MQRPTKDDYFMRIADVVATRSTCYRRNVGCVLVNERNHILSTGYNGVAAGQPHCNQYDMFDETGYPYMCTGSLAPSGTLLESCEAIHAEQNALLQCRDVNEITTCYCTTSPCITCVKLLLNTSCKRIVVRDDYSASGEELWKRAGREWVVI